MAREDRIPGRGDPGPSRQQRSPPRGSGARRQTGYLGRASASDAGRSGYGSESVRPYLRAQLRLKELMAGPLAQPNPLDKPGRRKSSALRSDER